MDNIKIPKNVENKALYKEAYKIAENTYDRPSAYRSMYMVKKYREMGGRYKDDDGTKKDDLKKRTKEWRDENWVQIKPFIKENKKVKCGAGDNAKACRPLNRTKKGDDNITMDEIIKKFGKQKVLELTEKKIKDMDGRLSWKTGTYTPSKDRKKNKKK